MLMFYIVAKSLIINNLNKRLKEHFQSSALLKKGNMQSSGHPHQSRSESILERCFYPPEGKISR